MGALGDMELTITADLPISKLDQLNAKLNQTKEAQQELKQSFSDSTAALQRNELELSAATTKLAALNTNTLAGAKAADGLRSKINFLTTEQTELNTELIITKSKLDNVTSSYKEQASAVSTAQRNQDSLGNAIGRFTNLNSVAAREVNNLGRRILNIGGAFAFGELTGGLSEAIPFIEGFFEKFIEGDEKIKLVSIDTKKLSDNFNSINESSAKEQASVLTLVSALQSKSLSRQQEIGAIKELQQISPQYFSNLSTESDLIKNLTTDYDKYKNSILATIQNKLDISVLESIQGKINDLDLKHNDNLKFVATTQERINDLYAKGDAIGAHQLETQLNGLKSESDKTFLLNQQDEILKRIQARGNEGVIKPTDFKTSGETISQILSKLEAQIKELNAEGLSLHVDEAEKEISEIQGAIDKLTKEKGLNPGNPIIIHLVSEIQDLNNEEIQKKLNKSFQKEKNEFFELDVKARVKFADVLPPSGGIEIPSYARGEKNANPEDTGTSVFQDTQQTQKAKGNFDQYSAGYLGLISLQKELTSEYVKFKNTDTFEMLIKKQQDYLKSTQKLADDITNSINNTIENIAKGIGDSIGNALSGNGGNFFSAIFKTLGAGIKQLGDYAIQYGVLKELLKITLSNPFSSAAAIGIGIGLEVLGTIIENSANSIPGFANGVQNFSGGVAIVGERGPELVQLPRGSNVIPNHQLQSVSGSASGGFVASTVLKGNDLLVVIDRANAQRGRNG